MKTTLYDQSGKKVKEMDLPAVFNQAIREDIVAKSAESLKMLERTPYGPNPEAGKRHSASGTISHKRHEWKGHYGKGIARLPRKTMWRRGTQFYWVGAEVTNTRGGRASSPPKAVFAFRKINKKEQDLALRIAISSSFNADQVKKHYSSLTHSAVSAVVESLPAKSKLFFAQLKAIFGNAFPLLLQQKEVRAGKGKRRGRQYKSSAGLLLVIGNKEKHSFAGVEVVQAKELNILNLYPLGRLTLFTQEAMKELSA